MSASRTYTLVTPRDAHGQPVRLFRANQANNTSKAIDQLCGICAGILADGEVVEKEAKFFADWASQHAPQEPVWPFTEILGRIGRIYADGRCDEEERLELKSIMEALCGYTDQADATESYASSLPLSSPVPDPVTFEGNQFVITGRFAFGTRRKVFAAIESKGGHASDSFPTSTTNFLVVGTFASRDWAQSSFGRKIERAVELRESGSGLAIIAESHWTRFIHHQSRP